MTKKEGKRAREKKTVLSFENAKRVNHGKSIRESHTGRRESARAVEGGIYRRARGDPRFPWMIGGAEREGAAEERARESERDASQEETKGFGSTYQPEVVTSPELEAEGH